MAESSPQISLGTISRQHRASDPAHSAWVSANAGSGKTYVLAQRVIRLMLAGVSAGKILCLTYTTAAAGEMANRVFGQLSAWSRLSDDELREQMAEIGEPEVDARKLALARRLFAAALEAPGGLKIQTIHAFCEALLHQFSLEANTSGDFSVIDERDQQDLLDAARRQTLAATGNDPELAAALQGVLTYASDQQVDRALAEYVKDRARFEDWVLRHDLSLDRASAAMGERLGLEAGTDELSVAQAALAKAVVRDDELARFAAAAGELGGKENLRIAALVNGYRAAIDSVEKFQIRKGLYLTDGGEPRKRLPGTKALRSDFPGLDERLEQEREQFADASERMRTVRMVEASRHLFILGGDIVQRYRRLQRARQALDFDDLIYRAANLLTRYDVRDWVHYKLDHGIDHILIDEAQDTNPLQWQIINALSEEFFAGEGARAGRSIFAVGDEKQSIYSFQGAQPARFDEQRQRYADAAAGLGQPFHDVDLPASFRSTRDVLAAVDRVFDDEANRKGLTNRDEAPAHEPIRAGDPGEVQIWPMLVAEEGDEAHDWLAPVDRQGPEPERQLARRIAETIRRWIDNGEILPGRGRPVRCGDVLILVRKRDRFVTAINRELKDAGLAAAGADRLNLTDHIAVQDLLSLAKWALLPEDDLSLAEVLKSPLFDVDEEMLFALAHGREGTLFDRLEEEAGDAHGDLAAIAAYLAQIRDAASIAPVYDFFQDVLGRRGGRRRFVARLGSEVDEVLDALLLAAINHDRRAGFGLVDFIHSLTSSTPQIKREMEAGRDEVRVLTVHSAKGLEAPVVFLVDPGSAPFSTSHRPPFARIPDAAGSPDGFCWQPTKATAVRATEEYFAGVAERAEEEYRRLLYVGMTRAADRLIVCGYAGKSGPQGRTWHAMVEDALKADAAPLDPQTGGGGWRWTQPHPSRRPRPTEQQPAAEPVSETTLPAWATRPPGDDAMTRAPPTLAPSQAYKLAGVAPADRGRGGLLEHGQVDPAKRGTALHHLMAQLPSLEPGDQRQVAQHYLETAWPDWPQADRDRLIEEAAAILEGDELSHLFAAGSRAEVPVAGNLETADGKFFVSGRIDRLVVDDERVIIVDYKSDPVVPDHADDIPKPYLVQMALYQRLIAGIYSDRPVEAAIVWTAGLRVMTIPDALLRQSLKGVAKA